MDEHSRGDGVLGSGRRRRQQMMFRQRANASRCVLHAFVRNGEPVVWGLLPLGDALCHTNAAYGWGMTMGMNHAFELVDALERNYIEGSS